MTLILTDRRHFEMGASIDAQYIYIYSLRSFRVILGHCGSFLHHSCDKVDTDVNFLSVSTENIAAIPK